MIQAVVDYFAQLTQHVGRGWNRYWYSQRDAFPLSILRILTGSLALAYLLWYCADLINWFGPHGLLPSETVARLTADSSNGAVDYYLSILRLTDSAVGLWTLHVAGLAIVVMFTVGLLSRISSVLSLVVVLSYVHRAPMITGQFETVLTMLMAYLVVAPTGAYLSIDQFLRGRRDLGRATGGHLSALVDKSTSANIGAHLIQVHVAALYLLMGLTKLAGTVWWSGEASWWLIAQSESRLWDGLTFLRDWPYVINLWTHAIVWFELLFGVLIWNRTLRPLLLALAIVHWILLAIATGLVMFCITMVVANIAFVSPEALRATLSLRGAGDALAAD